MRPQVKWLKHNTIANKYAIYNIHKPNSQARYARVVVQVCTSANYKSRNESSAPGPKSQLVDFNYLLGSTRVQLVRSQSQPFLAQCITAWHSDRTERQVHGTYYWLGQILCSEYLLIERNLSPVFLLSLCDSGNDAMGALRESGLGYGHDGLNVPSAVSPTSEIRV